MEAVRKNIEFQVLLWTFVGPFVALLTFFIILMKDPVTAPYFAFSVLVGLPLCWKWQKIGLGFACGILLMSLFLALNLIPSEEIWWHLGMTVSVIIGFTVTALSLEEAQQSLWKMQEDAEHQVQNLIRRDEKFHLDRVALESQVNSLQSTILSLTIKSEQLEKVVAEKSLQLQASRELVDMAREELIATQAEQEKNLQELFEKRHSISHLQERFDDCQAQLRVLSTKTIHQSKLEEELQQIKQELKAEEQQRVQLEKGMAERTAALYRAESELEKMQIRQKALSDEMSECIDSLTREKGLLESTLKHLQDELESMRGLVGQIEDEKESFRKQIETKAAFSIETLAITEAKKNKPVHAPSPEKMYLQLKEQFEEKSSVLHATRRELFRAQEQLLLHSLESEESQRSQMSVPFSQLESHLRKLEAERANEIEALKLEIQKLEELITHLTTQIA